MKASRKILVADDDADLCLVFSKLLETEDFVVSTTMSLEDTRRCLEVDRFDLILLDVQFPDGSGVDLLRELQSKGPPSPIIVMSGVSTIELAVEAMKIGARDFLAKPFDPSQLGRRIESVLNGKRRLEPTGSGIVYQSPQMAELLGLVETFAPTDLSILLRGESGTGKELTARVIHELSERPRGPFIDFDCASVPQTLLDSQLFGHERGAFTDATQSKPGKFELAHGGTLFLDEIGNLSFDAQAKLLRVLQERSFRRVGGTRLIRVDVRIVSATNLDLEKAMSAGTFREDLYYRLSEMTLTLPALRERSSDVLYLCDHFVQEFNEKYGKSVQGLSGEAAALVRAYPWPGNVRELRNALRTALLLCEGRIEPPDLPERVQRTEGAVPPITAASDAATGASGVHVPLQWPVRGERLDLKDLTRRVRHEVERHVILGLLERYGYSKAELSRCLGLDYKVTLQKLKELEIDAAEVSRRERRGGKAS